MATVNSPKKRHQRKNTNCWHALQALWCYPNVQKTSLADFILQINNLLVSALNAHILAICLFYYYHFFFFLCCKQWLLEFVLSLLRFPRRADNPSLEKKKMMADYQIAWSEDLICFWETDQIFGSTDSSSVPESEKKQRNHSWEKDLNRSEPQSLPGHNDGHIRCRLTPCVNMQCQTSFTRVSQ